MPFFFALLLGGLLFAWAYVMDAAAQDRYAAERKEMLAEIARDARETRRETGRAQLGERVMAAIERVPRHRLVPRSEEPYA